MKGWLRLTDEARFDAARRREFFITPQADGSLVVGAQFVGTTVVVSSRTPSGAVVLRIQDMARDRAEEL